MKLTAADIAHLKQREGLRLDSYLDTEDKMTIGYGHLVTEDDPIEWQTEGFEITEAEAEALFLKDVDKALLAAKEQAATLKRPDLLRDLTGVNFQLGVNWRDKFPTAWKNMLDQQWDKAAIEVATASTPESRSRWVKQTPARVTDFAAGLMKTDYHTAARILLDANKYEPDGYEKALGNPPI